MVPVFPRISTFHTTDQWKPNTVCSILRVLSVELPLRGLSEWSLDGKEPLLHEAFAWLYEHVASFVVFHGNALPCQRERPDGLPLSISVATECEPNAWLVSHMQANAYLPILRENPSYSAHIAVRIKGFGHEESILGGTYTSTHEGPVQQQRASVMREEPQSPRET